MSLFKRGDKLYRAMIRTKVAFEFLILREKDKIPPDEKNKLQVILIV